MRALLLAILVLTACKKKGDDTAPPPPPTFDERQACGGDADCAVVEIECCDHCNGGTAVGVHKDHAADVRNEYVPAGACADTACTLMACAPAEPICRAGRCGISFRGEESLPELPARTAP